MAKFHGISQNSAAQQEITLGLDHKQQTAHLVGQVYQAVALQRLLISTSILNHTMYVTSVFTRGGGTISKVDRHANPFVPVLGKTTIPDRQFFPNVTAHIDYISIKKSITYSFRERKLKQNSIIMSKRKL